MPCSTEAPLIHSPGINPACWVTSSSLSGHQYWLMLNPLSPAPLSSFLLSCSVTHIPVSACVRHCSVPCAEPSIFLYWTSWCWLCSAPVYLDPPKASCSVQQYQWSKTYSCPALRSLLKPLTGTSPRIEPQGKLLGVRPPAQCTSLTAVLWPLPSLVHIAQHSMGSFLAVGDLPSSVLWGGQCQKPY